MSLQAKHDNLISLKDCFVATALRNDTREDVIASPFPTVIASKAKQSREDSSYRLTYPSSYLIITPLMEDTPRQDATLIEVANSFLANLPSEEKQNAQTEVYNLVRWLGVSRKASSITPLDIDGSAERITPSAAEVIRPLLSYIHKKGFTKVNLASHVRVKKTPSKTATMTQQISKIQSALSREGYVKMKTELTALKSQRSEVTKEIRQAAADKDFSENAPLQAARERKSHLEGRIKELELILNSAKVITEVESTLQIKIGNTVNLRDLSSGRELHYTLADPEEANPTKGIISIASPIGKALLNKQKGQTISITAPAGTFAYLIEDIQ